MTLDNVISVVPAAIAITLGFAVSSIIMLSIVRAVKPKWLIAVVLCRMLKKELGIRASVHSVDEIGIIRLVVLSSFPVAERLDDIKDVLTCDVRLEADDKQRPVLAVLPPDKGIRKPGRKQAQPRLVPQLTPNAIRVVDTSSIVLHNPLFLPQIDQFLLVMFT